MKIFTFLFLFEEISEIEMCDMLVFVVVENKKGEY